MGIGLLQKPAFWIFLIVVGIIGILLLIFEPFKPNSPSSSPSKVSEKPKPDSAAIVNGEKILIKDFNYRYQSQLRFYQEVYPKVIGKNISDEFLSGLPKTVLDDMIMSLSLSQYLAKKGVTVTDEEVRQYVQESLIDPSYGGDWQKYEEYLAEQKTDLAIALSNQKKDVLIIKAHEVANIPDGGFDKWYQELLKNSQISIQLESY